MHHWGWNQNPHAKEIFMKKISPELARRLARQLAENNPGFAVSVAGVTHHAIGEKEKLD
jgi:hypothetical protein